MKKKTAYIILFLTVIILTVVIGFIYFYNKGKSKTNKELIEKFMNTNMGAVNTELLFADKNKVIFYDGPALMVYDIVNKKMIRTVDLQELGVKCFQGDEAYSIYASKNGEKIFFEKANQTNRFMYDVEKNRILKSVENELFKKENYFNDYMQGVEPETDEFVPLSQVVKIDNEQYMYLTNTSSDKLDGLEIVIVKSGKKEATPIFPK